MKKYYEGSGCHRCACKGTLTHVRATGGFEDKMTTNEASLILGLRRSASEQKIKEKHRKLIVANHPDSGGSPLIAAKINTAKDILLKGTREKQ